MATDGKHDNEEERGEGGEKLLPTVGPGTPLKPGTSLAQAKPWAGPGTACVPHATTCNRDAPNTTKADVSVNVLPTDTSEYWLAIMCF